MSVGTELLLLALPALQPEAHTQPFWYSEDNTPWTQSPTKRALDFNCTILIFHFFWHEKLLFYPPTLGSVVPFIEIPFPIETLCFTLPESCVNSSVSLI